MKGRTALMTLLVAGIVFLAYGCSPLFLGHGVAGGISISGGTARVTENVTYDKAWNASRSVVEEMGTVTLLDKAGGQVGASIQESDVLVQVQPATPESTRILVTATKYRSPSIDLAVEILNQIRSNLGTQTNGSEPEGMEGGEQ